MFNEEAVLRCWPTASGRSADAMVDDGVCAAYEIVAVDDGSTDATPVLPQRLRRTWPEVRVLRLRANAGHQAAISAGLARARGDYVVTLDADLQDPPEVIREMLTIARTEGVDVVYGCAPIAPRTPPSNGGRLAPSIEPNEHCPVSTPRSTPGTTD